MATVPSQITWVVGQVVTAAQMNSNVRDAVNFVMNPPTCEVRQTVAQSIPNNATTAILMDTEDIDNDSMHSTSSNTSRITAQTAGRYMLYGGVGYSSASATGARLAFHQINGGSLSASSVEINATNGYNTTMPSRTKTAYLNVGDYVEMCALQTSGGALNTANGSDGSSLGARWIATV